MHNRSGSVLGIADRSFYIHEHGWPWGPAVTDRKAVSVYTQENECPRHERAVVFEKLCIFSSLFKQYCSLVLTYHCW